METEKKAEKEVKMKTLEANLRVEIVKVQKSQNRRHSKERARSRSSSFDMSRLEEYER